MSVTMQTDQDGMERSGQGKEATPLKSPDLFSCPGINFRWIRSALNIVVANLLFWPRIRRILKHTSDPYLPHNVTEDFFGLNITPGPNASFDDYLIARLDELGLKSVRMNLGYDRDDHKNMNRLVQRLHDLGYHILLQLLQPPSEAFGMGGSKQNMNWRVYLKETLQVLGGKIEAVEIGSTINRFSWAGYTVKGYVRAAQIAEEVCREHGIKWYGGNVSDFAPLYNVATLAGLRRAGCLPCLHTDNLFVDRSGQPENHDTHLLPLNSERLRMDLVGKLRVLASIGQHFGSPGFISTYAYWTLKKFPESRKFRYVDPDQAARYLVRYFVLSASSGYAEKVYWGQLVSHSKGLIGDDTGYKPRVPMVYGHRRMGGHLENYRIRPGFHAYRQVISILKNTRFLKRIPTSEGTFLFEFARKEISDDRDRRIFVGWTHDGMADRISHYLLPPANGILRIENMRGNALHWKQATLGPDPIYIFGANIADNSRRETTSAHHLRQLMIPQAEDQPYIIRRHGKWRVLIRRDMLTPTIKDCLDDPDSLFSLTGGKIVKSSKRGRLFEMHLDSIDAAGENVSLPVMLKRMNTRRFISDRTQSRAAKAWNNSCKIIQRGIQAPVPLILIDHVESPTCEPSYMVVENLRGYIPLRHVLNAVRSGKSLPIDVDRNTFVRLLAGFVREIHKNGIYHRDLTGGNILLSPHVIHTEKVPRLKFALIDVARSRFRRRVSLLDRHRDLSRVRLPARDRWLFYDHYQSGAESIKRRRWIHYRIIHALYRMKYNLKSPRRILRLLRRR